MRARQCLAANLAAATAATSEPRAIHGKRILSPNAKVSDGSQPPMMFNLSLSETAGFRSLHRLVRIYSRNLKNFFIPTF